MVAIPAPVPVTTPVLPTVAMAVLLLLHTPPGAPSIRLMVLPTHTLVGPLMVPALAARLTVTVEVAWQEPIA